MSIALIAPDETRRAAALQALAECPKADVYEYSFYPDLFDELTRLVHQQHNVVIIEIDSNPEIALGLVENICARGDATVMVYSAKAEPDLLVRCMRAGAREFLPVPFAPGVMEEALARAAVRRPVVATHTVRSGKLLVFMGAKGGVGVTSLACNYAVALAEVAHQKTILIDLDLPLGDAALNLGIVSEYSTVDALEAGERLDGVFLSKLLVKHSTGLWVLAAPGHFPHYEPRVDSIERLLTAARQEFDNVIVDVGSRLDPLGTALYRDASVVYLVTQAGIPELRNANRLISQVFANGGPKLEIVLNRYELRTLGVSEEHITKALTRPAQWKIPNDHLLVRKMQINATPFVLSDNPLARSIREMAQSASGATLPEVKKKGFRFFG